ncbi:M20/M25/M40 family metallo-hydrolase [Dyella solisilvae]|uniref:M20/M25/M40 family metallo-hydrolase n=1 Tax=Dyella solisilvae TaxID=1920168 RepID=A0A370KB48_9GAMM|nr:M20/M25/M40 family metallo-hydrolase [Dyella solisilvae]RDI99884.1 M20/M25/M40 family metallo-hydrolase [Dyella solisilvae]
MIKTLLAAMLPLAIALPAQATTLDPHQTQARDIFSHVIALKTEIGQGQVPVMAKYLAEQFRAAGFADSDIHILPLGETASMVVRYRGDGTGGKPVALMAHMDVVTAKPEDWQRDPFKLVEENGYFYGRGTQDIKSGVTVLAANFIRLKKEGFVPTRDLIIVFTGDEETTQDTMEDLVKNHRDLVDAEYALNTDAGGGDLSEAGKPLVFGLQTAEKAYASFELTTRNPGGHSSLPRKDNAIYELADALKKVQAYQFPVMWNDTTLASFKALGAATQGNVGQAMRDFAKNPHDAAAAAVLADEPSEVGKTRTTCVATLLRGGHADNALPQSATATINCRVFPGVAIDTVRQALQEQVGPKVEVTLVGKAVTSDPSPLRPDVVAAVTKAVHSIHPGVPVTPVQDSGASDGIYFRAVGIPTYGVDGMFMKNSDDFAHGLNERVMVKSFYDDLAYWYVLLKTVGGPAR